MKWRLSFFFLFFLLSCCAIFSQKSSDKTAAIPSNALSYDDATWTLVANGEVILPPKRVSGGFVVFTDGRLFTRFSNEGAVLYEKGLRVTNPNFFVTLSNDFLALVSDGNNLTILNSSGDKVWEKKIPFPVNSVTQGEDGRIFLSGGSQVACLDMTGRFHWTLDTSPLKNTPINIFNDGSLFLLLNEAGPSGGSRVLRLSPFGSLLETIDYDGTLVSAQTVDDGVLLNFSSGEFGLAIVDANSSTAVPRDKGEAAIAKASIPWALKEKGSQKISHSLWTPLTRDITALLIEAGGATKVIVFWNKSGKVIYSFVLDGKALGDIKDSASAMAGRGLFLADSREATVYDLTGAMSITRTMPSSSDKLGGYNYCVFSGDNLTLFCPSWLVGSFRLVNTPKKSKDPFKRPAKGGLDRTDQIYSGFYSKLQYTYIDKAVVDERDFKTLSEGYYGTRERDLASRIYSATRVYCDSLSIIKSSRGKHQEELIVSQVRGLYTNFMKQLFLLGGLKATTFVAYLIKEEKDPAFLRIIFSFVNLFPYDDGDLMLKAIRYRAQTIPNSDAATLVALCDAVATICTFMGRNYEKTYGVEILSNFLGREYSERVRVKARGYLNNFTR